MMVFYGWQVAAPEAKRSSASKLTPNVPQSWRWHHMFWMVSYQTGRKADLISQQQVGVPAK